MARNRGTVLLGFEDELVTEKHRSIVNFTTNKIGGKPDFPENVKLETEICPLCHLPRPLVLQIYAPLENSVFHRTLYLFGCINPNCWKQDGSWTCIRVESQEKIIEAEEAASLPPTFSVTDWCVGADDWGDANANVEEQNGNLISNLERVSDEDEESCSLDESLQVGLGNLSMEVDDQNANVGALGGAVGRLHSPSATAEIEGDESEVISIDTPVLPQRDIVALLQEVTPLPQDLCHTKPELRQVPQFVSAFIDVCEEIQNANASSTISDRHIRELIQKYQESEGELGGLPEDASAADKSTFEKYEKANPAHGDKMFHHFMSRIKMNPGQILRYGRDVEDPLLMYPLQEFPSKCAHCQSDLVFEFQVLPTIIPKLKLTSDVKNCTRIEFGNVLVFTCRKSCWSTDKNVRYETVVVQTEKWRPV